MNRRVLLIGHPRRPEAVIEQVGLADDARTRASARACCSREMVAVVTWQP